MPADEVDFKKDLVDYFKKVIMATLHEALKTKYQTRSIRHSILWVQNKLNITIPFEDMTMEERVTCIATIAEFATKEFGITFKSSNEV